MSQDQSVEDQNNEYLKQINDQNNSLIYKNVFPNADMAYSVDGEELKEDIILYSKPSFTELVYTINVNNLGFRKETHEYAGYNEDTKEEKKYQKEVGVFYDLKTNDQIFKLDNFYMYDSNGKASYDLEWGYTEIDGEYILKIYIDEKFLNDPEIKYPVVIDPTVQGPSVTYDTYASRKYPDNNYYLNTYIRTGKDADYGIRRTFIKWDLPSIATKYPITTAEIQLRKYSSAGATNLNAVRLTTSWSSSSVTWWNSPDSTTTHATMSGSWSGDWYKLDVTKFTRRWHCGRYSNYGVKIYDDNESSENVWTTFCSSDYSTASYTPKLIVNIYTGTSLWTRYTGGYYSRSIPIRNDLSSTYYSTQFSPAISAWTNSEANCTVYSSSSTDNRVAEVSSSESYYGLYIPYDNGGNPTQRFSIWLNYRTIEADKEWDGFARDVLIHELGHALWLNDREGDSYCIMGYSRDRNTLMHPAASDIAGVNSKWP